MISWGDFIWDELLEGFILMDIEKLDESRQETDSQDKEMIQ